MAGIGKMMWSGMMVGWVWCGLAGAQVLTLSVDATAVQIHQQVNVTATVQGGPGGGRVQFLDNGEPVVTLALSSAGNAVLSTAGLGLGWHSLMANYVLPTGATLASAPVGVQVAGVPVAFTAATAKSVYTGSPLGVTVPGLPTEASGTVTLSEGGSPLASTTIQGSSQGRYESYGDSITAGLSVSDPSQRYTGLLATKTGLALTDRAIAGAMACDLMPLQILPNHAGATQVVDPLYSVMIGTNDTYFFRAGTHESLFENCHQAALSWLGVPREYKVLGGDAGVQVTSGNWSYDPTASDATYGTLYEAGRTGGLRFTITSSGGPLYLWYLVGDHLAGSFTVTVDGVAQPLVYSSQSVLRIGSNLNGDQETINLLRFAVLPGAHTVEVTATGGSVGILAVGTPPTAGAASVHPTVLVTDVPTELTTDPAAPPADTLVYAADVKTDVAQLLADGLDVRFVPTTAFMQGTPAEMYDAVHPNALGHAHLMDALNAVLAVQPVVPVPVFAAAGAPAASVTLTQVGTHVLEATYSGDAMYAPAARTVTMTVLPKTVTATSLTTSQTYYAGSAPVVMTASVTPAGATGSVTMMDGLATLGTATLTNGTATWSGTLGLGAHSLSAYYGGDADDLTSWSPELPVQVGPARSAVTLGALPAEVPYGTALTLSASVTPLGAGGNVLFQDAFTAAGQAGGQSSTLATVAVNSTGVAAMSAAGLLPGNHILTALYAGDATDEASLSPALTVVVDALATTTVLAPVAATMYGTGMTLTATVTPAGSGTVVFRDAVSGGAGAGGGRGQRGGDVDGRDRDAGDAYRDGALWRGPDASGFDERGRGGSGELGRVERDLDGAGGGGGCGFECDAGGEDRAGDGYGECGVCGSERAGAGPGGGGEWRRERELDGAGRGCVQLDGGVWRGCGYDRLGERGGGGDGAVDRDDDDAGAGGEERVRDGRDAGSDGLAGRCAGDGDVYGWGCGGGFGGVGGWGGNAQDKRAGGGDAHFGGEFCGGCDA